MANTFTGKLAANGQLATSKATIYTAPASTVAYRPCITLYNTNAAQQTIALYVKASGGTSRQIAQYIISQNERAVFDERVILSAGAVIEAMTTTATAVDYTVSLVEEA